MTMHVKRAGAWTNVERPYVKRSGVWTGAQEVWVKRSGAWVRTYQFDSTPPLAPVLEIALAGGHRYHRVGVRGQSIINDFTIKRIRVLVSNKEFPANHLSSGYVATPDASYPKESWSDYWYNGWGPNGTKNNPIWHPGTATFAYKENPVNVSSTQYLAAGTWYYAAWAEDEQGRWGPGIAHKLVMPKKGSYGDARWTRASRFRATSWGSQTGVANDDGLYLPGQLIVDHNTGRSAVINFSNAVPMMVGSSGRTPVTVTEAHLALMRKATSPGPSAVNLRMWYHSVNDEMGIDPETQTIMHEGKYILPGQKLGTTNVTTTLAKGEYKWVPLPTSWFSKMDDQFRGIGLAVNGANYASEYATPEDNAWSAELVLRWTEG